MKQITIIVLMLFTTLPAFAQVKDSTDTSPRQIIVTAEAKVYLESESNANLLFASGQRIGPFGPYLFAQAGEDHSTVFVGPLWHAQHGYAGVGAGYGLNLLGAYDDQTFAATVFGEHHGHDNRLRAHVAVRTKPNFPKMQVGWFYQHDLGHGPRLEFDLGDSPARLWICINHDFQKEIFGFRYCW